MTDKREELDALVLRLRDTHCDTCYSRLSSTGSCDCTHDPAADAIVALRELAEKAEAEEATLAAENDRLFAQVEALTRRVRELESAPVAEEVEAMAQNVDDQAENAEDWAGVAENEIKRRWNTAQAAELSAAAAMLRSLSRQIAAKDARITKFAAMLTEKDAEISARSDLQQAYLDCWRNERERAERAEAENAALRADASMWRRFAIALAVIPAVRAALGRDHTKHCMCPLCAIDAARREVKP